jgi:enamine deaminase RidA (YjgF/YER057c/UK114 family)
MDPATGHVLHPQNPGLQTLQALDNVRAILEAGGATVADVVMVRVYLTARDHYAAMNEAYQRFWEQHAPGTPPPCRTTVFVGLPLPQMLVEIDAQACID